MRIDSIKAALAGAQPHLSIKAQTVDNNKNTRVTGVRETIAAIEAIRATGILREACDGVLQVESLALSNMDPVVVPCDVFTKFNSALTNLRNRVHIVSQAFEELVHDLPANSVRISLPPTQNLKEASNHLKELDIVLNQALANSYIEGKIELARFASGSLWVDVALGSYIALQTLAGLVRLYFEVRKKSLQLDASGKLLEDLNAQVEMRDQLRDTLKQLLDPFRAKKLRSLLDNAKVPEDDSEFEVRFGKAFDKLGKLLESGLEVHPNLAASKEEQSLLPDVKKLKETLKLLPSNSSIPEDSK